MNNDSEEFKRCVAMNDALRKKVVRLEFIVIALVDCFKESNRWHKASGAGTDVWNHNSTEFEIEMADELAEEYCQ